VTLCADDLASIDLDSAHNLMEGAGERRLIAKPACAAMSDSDARVCIKRILGALNPALHEPSVSGDTEARLE